MIDPYQITNYVRTESELEEFILFGIAVTNKSAVRTAYNLALMLNDMDGDRPFDKIIRYIKKNGYDRLAELLHYYRITPHKMKATAMSQVCHHMVKYYSAECLYGVLIQVKGIGRKTAAFICTHSFREFDKPILDTHILRWLKAQGVENVPKSTPSSEAAYNRLCDEFMRLKPVDKTVAEFDLEIWSEYARV